MAKNVEFSNERTVRDFALELATEGHSVNGTVTTKEGVVTDASMSVIYPDKHTVPVVVSVQNGETYVSPGRNPISIARDILDAVDAVVAAATTEGEEE